MSLAAVMAVATLGHSSMVVLMTVGGRSIAHAKEIEDIKMIAIVAMIACARMTADMTAGMTVDIKMIAGTADMIVDAKMTMGIAVIAMMMIIVMEETSVVKAVMISMMVGVTVKGGLLHPLLM
jgi:hypothetical protein